MKQNILFFYFENIFLFSILFSFILIFILMYL